MHLKNSVLCLLERERSKLTQDVERPKRRHHREGSWERLLGLAPAARARPSPRAAWARGAPAAARVGGASSGPVSWGQPGGFLPATNDTRPGELPANGSSSRVFPFE